MEVPSGFLPVPPGMSSPFLCHLSFHPSLLLKDQRVAEGMQDV